MTNAALDGHKATLIRQPNCGTYSIMAHLETLCGAVQKGDSC